MTLKQVSLVIKKAKLNRDNKEKALKVYEKMEKEGVTELLRGQLLQIFEDELETSKTEISYFKDLKVTLEGMLSDTEKRLRMANEEIEEESK